MPASRAPEMSRALFFISSHIRAPGRREALGVRSNSFTQFVLEAAPAFAAGLLGFVHASSKMLPSV
jgi:hypothetical protein